MAVTDLYLVCSPRGWRLPLGGGRLAGLGVSIVICHLKGLSVLSVCVTDHSLGAGVTTDTAADTAVLLGRLLGEQQVG